jgi:hypothetical protein
VIVAARPSISVALAISTSATAQMLARPAGDCPHLLLGRVGGDVLSPLLERTFREIQLFHKLSYRCAVDHNCWLQGAQDLDVAFRLRIANESSEWRLSYR